MRAASPLFIADLEDNDVRVAAITHPIRTGTWCNSHIKISLTKRAGETQPTLASESLHLDGSPVGVLRGAVNQLCSGHFPAPKWLRAAKIDGFILRDVREALR